MRIIGLTGGTGSGKSEAARRFGVCGVPSVDADAIGHALLAPGEATVDAVVKAFGAEILCEGVVDRTKLGACVFRDPAAIRRLNAIMHPRIFQEIARRLVEFEQAGRPVAIVDAAVIAENGKRDPWMDGLIVVCCRDDLRIERLVSRRGFDREEVLRRIAAQTPAESKVAFADWVIRNEGTLEFLYDQVDRIADALLEETP